MTRITAIELENFQAIERRTRIELKPITLMYGPNSAGKSSIFDAIELLRVILDPAAFDQQKAADMLDRWARHPGSDGCRETKLAIEFPFAVLDESDPWQHVGEIWRNPENWSKNEVQTDSPSFYIDEEHLPRINGKTVRIEILLEVVGAGDQRKSFISEFSIEVGGVSLVRLDKKSDMNDHAHDAVRLLTLSNELGFVPDLISRLQNLPEKYKVSRFLFNTKSGYAVQQLVYSGSLSPRSIIVPPGWRGLVGAYHGRLEAELQSVCVSVGDLFFFFGAMLCAPLRNSPGLVLSDRRAPKPTEALAVVDLELQGWRDTSKFSPSSPAYLLKSAARIVDEHYQKLAEVAHAALLQKTIQNIFWQGRQESALAEELEERANILNCVNDHLQKSLFTEKLYQLSCASTLMVPLNADEGDPWGYYALAQPATVRLFLRDSTGQKVELQDVGSGIPFVLPVLYAVCAQGFVAVQQPELHLHPALQSALADVFIEETHRKGFGQFLIETHSEHLLLRLLRRIKSTTKETCLSKELQLNNEDVAVYYFDPQVGGGTFVSRQLITPLGDFYNDWPRGFFSERNVDLFGE